MDDQPSTALDVLAMLGEMESSSVRIVAPDDGLRKSFLAAAESEGVAVDCWEGDPSASTRLGHLVQMLIPLAETTSASAVGDLIRHPDVEAWLMRAGVDRPLTVWDEVWSRHAPHGLEGLVEIADATDAQSLLAHMQTITSRLDGVRELSAWADVIMSLLLDLLEGADLDEVADTVLDQIHGLLTDLHELPPDAGDWSAEGVLRLLLAGLMAQTASPQNISGGVEVIGWLDAHLDDAPHLVIMGMNEGVIPSSPGVDPWLPEAHRAAISLDCRARRVARDAYLLAATIESGRHVQLITARATNTGEPLAPSGLLLRDGGQALASRVLRCVGEEEEATARVSARRSGGEQASAFDRWPLPEGEPDIRSMSVTSFRGFLEDPYAFLLKRDARIHAQEVETHFELDAMQFGILIHKVLEMWGVGEAELSTPTTDARQIEIELHDALNRVVHARFGTHALPMVRLQTEIVRGRLTAFAARQAERAAQGWKIHAVELSFGGSQRDNHPPVQFPVEEGLPLHGKIDRVDVHEDYGFQALDYKTGATASGAKASHWSSRGGWVDLQLPLYRALLRSIGTTVPASGLGYVLIPAASENCRFDLADWTEVDLEEAEAEASKIVRIITRGELLDRVAEFLS